MTTLKTYEQMEDFFLYISFHPVDISTLNSTVHQLDSLMGKRFGDLQKREEVSKEELEIVYRIQKPIFVSNDEMKNYFLELKSLFNAVSHLTPHFTQFEVDEK